MRAPRSPWWYRWWSHISRNSSQNAAWRPTLCPSIKSEPNGTYFQRKCHARSLPILSVSSPWVPVVLQSIDLIGSVDFCVYIDCFIHLQCKQGKFLETSGIWQSSPKFTGIGCLCNLVLYAVMAYHHGTLGRAIPLHELRDTLRSNIGPGQMIW